MKFTLAPLALAMAMATLAFAQDETAATTTSAEATATSAETSSATSAATGAEQTGVCELLPGYEEGNPQQVNYGCPYTTTSTPTYDSMSLQEYLIGGYRPGKEGQHIEDVAEELARSVTSLYPTLTVDFDAIASQYEEAIIASTSAARAGEITVDGALTMHANKILGAAGIAVALVAGGAFLL